MSSTEATLHSIEQGFAAVAYPGDGFLVGSTDGCEPEEEVGPFRGKTDWRLVDAKFLDGQAGALNFFSEAGLRFFLPAYLAADVRRQLKRADPMFVLTHGFSDLSIPTPIGNRTFTIKTGRSAFINPLRYGAQTFGDNARARLSIFAREEAGAIVDYLKFRRASDEHGFDAPKIDAALDVFWRERAMTAPTQVEIQRYLDDQAAYIEAISRPPE